ncbi:NYN domain-containing protein [Glaciihabitans sp. INWT7]|uniref:NYN domain-containing protein n=1 Tax=Glaciihabitans sp. INWT7 TaxID=2596912 RepID=UPI0016250E69|nr:NYN domain-containing protein [Glaciihabitans sp. INWT7]QNE47329.1 NYN domain-containing protein [Glaciihabitans sp. INWT7]
MPEPTDTRVAVYIDFDNIVVSRYNQLHGARRFSTDGARNFGPDSAAVAGAAGVIGTRLREATVDFGAVLDYASSFGPIVISRAYADWSAKANASYQKQLIDRAVDLTQLFPTTQAMKNGADIRLAVDVVEDLFRLDDLTHVVIVAGDSDYIALAQRCKRLGRYVVGIGVAGATSRSLVAACDEFQDYDDLPGLVSPGEDDSAALVDPPAEVAVTASEPPPKTPRKQPAADRTKAPAADDDEPIKLSPRAATNLMIRALRLGIAKSDSEWMPSSEVKKQMRRMDPAFSESALGYKTFTDFVKSRSGQVEMDDGGANNSRRIRLRAAASPTG